MVSAVNIADAVNTAEQMVYRPHETIIPAARHILALLPADLEEAIYSELRDALRLARAATEIQVVFALRTPEGSPERQGAVWLRLSVGAIADELQRRGLAP